MRNTLLRGLVVLAALAVGTPAARAQGALESLRAMWRAGSYRAAYDGLKEYRKQPYGKTFEVYYMAGTSLCRLENRADLGVSYLQWVLDNYNLAEKARSTVVDEQKNQCPPADRTATDQPVVIAWNTTAATAGVSGKTKMFYFADGDNALRSVPVKVLREIPREELVKRLFPPSARDDAMASAAKLAGGNAEIVAGKHFVLASRAGQTAAQLKTMAGRLDHAYDFFVSEYGIRPPESLITAYLVPDMQKLQQLADSMHGIEVAPQSLGYSYRDDMSMVGFVPATGVGTLLHELFHLMVRNDFGDIPPWMDEGMAALYEVSRVDGDSVMGTTNWRGRVLQELWGKQPSVEELVKMNWLDFSGAEDEYSTALQAANHAKARYLMLYLQEKGKLTAVYKQFQAREVGQDSVELLKKVLDVEDLDGVEQSFEEWFRRTHQP